MAGNKALEKFKDSKIPKKGQAKVIIEIPVYKEPNTKSQIIGTIKKNQEITWISKSICDEREWIRCNNKNNYGYIVGYEKDCKCNLDLNSIKEKNDSVEKKEEVIPITKEEINLGNEALNEILNDDFDKKDDKDDGSKTNISTELDESNKSYYSGFEKGKNKTGIKIEEDDEDWDNFFENDINKIDFIKSENEKLINEIKCQMEKEESKNNNGDENSVSKAISNLEEDLPEKEKSKIEQLLEELNAKSKIIRRQNIENGTNIDKVEIDGKMYPLDYSDNVGEFKQAKRYGKKLNNIPKNDPGKEVDNKDRRGNYQWEQGKVYEYERIKDGKKEKIQLRDDRAGHKFEGGYELPPHINDSEGRHFFYKPKEGGKKKK